MATRVRIHDWQHPWALDPDANGAPGGRFWRQWKLKPCTHVVVAENSWGLLRLDWYPDHELLHARGTYVEPSQRATGLALEMWEAALRKFRPERVKVATATKAGRAMVCAVARRHHRIQFEIL